MMFFISSIIWIFEAASVFGIDFDIEIHSVLIKEYSHVLDWSVQT
jgi:hypothetical protein